MKKIFMILLSVNLIFGLVGCEKEGVADPKQKLTEQEKERASNIMGDGKMHNRKHGDPIPGL